MRFIIICVFILSPGSIFAQPEPELPLILDHPGTFQIHSADYIQPECGFIKSDMTANLQKITDLVYIVCKNPVLNDVRGFDGRARIYNIVNCKEDGGYGVPSRVSFEFAAWYRKKDGTAKRGFIEPPEWSVIVNKLKPNSIWGFSKQYSGEPRYFVVPKKESVEQGIDVYNGECYVIYNPGRPPYWLPVTIREAFTAVTDEYNTYDKITKDFMMSYLEKEKAAFSEEDLNKPAYYNNQSHSHICSNKEESQIMRINPDYWDKNLPKSAIQFLYFRSVPDKAYIHQLKEEYLKNNSISYHLARFDESFDLDNIRSLVPLIGD
jgi:hypothetical protein